MIHADLRIVWHAEGGADVPTFDELEHAIKEELRKLDGIPVKSLRGDRTRILCTLHLQGSAIRSIGDASNFLTTSQVLNLR